ncbi:MAG TPA: damage-inducible protein CinA, partial [Deltaproteobacteria bacterium]|nr:damage-inducible protein CinA [Deltaproteobacteria bacterium]
MIVEIIATGNEVVEGDVVNSNASWLALRAREQGWEVRFHTAVPDEESCIAAALRQAVGRAQIVLVTGGLGPTSDDLTLEIAARAFARPLQVDVPSLERIRGFFTRLGRKLTPNQEKQALIPQGSRVLPNEVGTAPGAYWREGGTHLAFFPGVPQEMKKMFTRHFLPQMAAWAGGKVQLAKTLHCFGLPEGELDHRLTPLLGEGRKLGEVLVGFRVRFPTLDLRLRAEAADAAGAQEKLAQAAASIRAALGEYVFGEDEVRLEEVVGRLLREKKQKLAVAESCTGGLLVDWMTDIPGASDYFLEGAVTYSNAAKVRQLGVSPG